MTSFSGGWGANAPLWYTADGGQTWTKEFSIAAPPGRPAGCPCDQTVDYGRNGTLYGTFLMKNPMGGFDITSGSTSDPTQSSSWGWTGNPAQLTNPDGSSPGIVDQPWIVINRDATTAANDDAFVSYDELGGGHSARVEGSVNSAPPNFTRNQIAGSQDPGNGANGSPRLAKDRSNGRVYALWQTSTGASSPRTVTLHLNRTADSNQSWTLNGSATGITLSSTFSQDEYDYSFGQANTLQGGVHHVAVDPTNGDVYVVFGRDDDGATTTQRNTMYIDRLSYDGAGNLNVAAGYPVAVSTSHDTALPSVAVTSDGTVGVLYDTFDGTSGGFPQFSAHLARSTDHGLTFQDDVLKQFLSPTAGTGVQGRRDLGDYQQIKAEGTTLFGVFSGNRQAFSASANNVIDPIWFSTATPTADLTTSKTAPAQATAGTDLTYTITATNAGAYTALNPSISDALPANSTFVSVGETAGPTGWNCTNPGVGSNGVVTCSGPSLTPSQSITFSLVVHLSPSTPPGTLSNTATTSSQTPDSNPLDNSGNANVTVVASADLATTKTGPTQTVPGSNITYALHVVNHGPSDSASPSLSDPLPAGTTFVAETHPGGWTCTDPPLGSPGTMTCSAATLPLNATVNFTLTVHVSPSAAGTTLHNTATASSATPDPNAANNAGVRLTQATCDHNLTGNVPGAVILSGGSWCIVSATVGGGISVASGTVVIVSNSTLKGALSATDSPAGISVCNSTVQSVTVIGSTGFVLIGDPGDDLCLGDTVHGQLSFTANHAGLEVGHNGTTNGVSMNSNSGTGAFAEDAAPEVEGNTLGGSLTCSGNTPAPTNDLQPNNVTGARTGQCSGL